MEWYEELDYEENPFKDNEDTELIGYENVIDEVLYRLESGNIVCVEGKSGAGKTAVLKAAINKFKGTGRLIYLDTQNMSNGLNIEKLFKKKSGLIKRLFNKKPKNMIVLMDEVQNLSQKNCERLKYYFDNHFIKSVVFTSSDFNKANFTPSLKERVSKMIKLREITEDEAVDIVQSRLGSDEIIPEEVVKEVFSRSNRNMKSFLSNCEKLCAFALETNGKKVLPEHLKEVFDQEVEEVKEEPKKSETKQVEKKVKTTAKKTKKSTNKKSKTKSKTKSPKSTKIKKPKTTQSESPSSIVEEPVTVSIVDDFKPEQKGEKMKKNEEIDIDDELKKLSKANKLEDEDELLSEDYEEDYSEFEETDEDETDNPKKVEDSADGYDAEKYY